MKRKTITLKKALETGALDRFIQEREADGAGTRRGCGEMEGTAA